MSVVVIHDWEGLLSQTKVAPTTAAKKKAKKVGSNKYPAFHKCKDHMLTLTDRPNNQKWADYFSECGDGKLPIGFSIIGSMVTHTAGRKRSSVSLTMDVSVLCEKLITFFLEHDKYIAIVEERAKKQKSGKNYDNLEDMKWTEIRKQSIRDNLIFDYINRIFQENEWDVDRIPKIYSDVLMCVKVYGADLKNVNFANGRIESIPSIEIHEDHVVPLTYKKVQHVFVGKCEDLDIVVEIYNGAKVEEVNIEEATEG